MTANPIVGWARKVVPQRFSPCLWFWSYNSERDQGGLIRKISGKRQPFEELDASGHGPRKCQTGASRFWISLLSH